MWPNLLQFLPSCVSASSVREMEVVLVLAPHFSGRSGRGHMQTCSKKEISLFSECVVNIVSISFILHVPHSEQIPFPRGLDHFIVYYHNYQPLKSVM